MKTEIELRGLLSKEEFARIKKLLERKGKQKDKFKRIFVDFTPFLKIKNLDIRVRVTNDETELIVKSGKWLGTKRKEVSIKIEKSNLADLFLLLKLLGIKKGILGIRYVSRYVYNDIEFSLVEVVKINKNLKEKKGFSFFYEAEGNDKKEIEKTLKMLNLNIISEDEFVKYVKFLNRKANIIFHATEDMIRKLKNVSWN